MCVIESCSVQVLNLLRYVSIFRVDVKNIRFAWFARQKVAYVNKFDMHLNCYQSNAATKTSHTTTFHIFQSQNKIRRFICITAIRNMRVRVAISLRNDGCVIIQNIKQKFKSTKLYTQLQPQIKRN